MKTDVWVAVALVLCGLSNLALGLAVWLQERRVRAWVEVSAAQGRLVTFPSGAVLRVFPRPPPTGSTEKPS